MRFTRDVVGNLLGAALIASTVAIPWWTGRQLPWTMADAWYRAPPPDLSWDDRRIYAGIYEVPDDRAAEAQRLLEEQAVVELRPEELRRFAARDTLAPPGFKPYLIRAVHLGRRGHYFIALSGDAVVVMHETPAAAPSAMRKRPLVAFLPRKPREVYVTLDAFR